MRIEDIWREAFAPDSGILFDFHIYGTTAEDYRELLKWAVPRFGGRYMRDSVEGDVPEYEQIVRDYVTASVFVKLLVSEVRVNLWFHLETEIELDLLPDDVNSVEKAQGITRFMASVSGLLNKRVLLTAEHGSADEEWSKRHWIFRAEPPDGIVEYHSDSAEWSRY